MPRWNTWSGLLVFSRDSLPGRAAAGAGDPASRRTARAGPGRIGGIGGAQTGIYPLATPGGWQLLGRTALTLFDPARKEPALLRAWAIKFALCRKGGVC